MRIHWLVLLGSLGCGGASEPAPIGPQDSTGGSEPATTAEHAEEAPFELGDAPPPPAVAPTQLSQADFPTDHEGCGQVFPMQANEGIELHMPSQIVVDPSQEFGLCGVAGDLPMCVSHMINAARAVRANESYVVFTGSDGVEHRGQPGECDPNPIAEDPSPAPPLDIEQLRDMLTGGSRRVNARESMTSAIDVGPGHYRVQIVAWGYRSNIVEVDVAFAPTP